MCALDLLDVDQLVTSGEPGAHHGLEALEGRADGHVHVTSVGDWPSSWGTSKVEG